MNSASGVFRIFRLLRVFKFASVWPSFNTFLGTIGSVIKNIATSKNPEPI